MEDFYITLMSDSSLNIYPNNTVAEFRCNLVKPINLNKEEWRVALTEITYPGAILIVIEGEQHFELTLPDNIEVLEPGPYRGTIPLGFYDTPLQFMQMINACIKDILDRVIKININSILESDDVLQILLKFRSSNSVCELHTIPANVNIGLTFHPNICRKLGFLNATTNYILHPIDIEPSPFKEPVNLLINDSSIYVYIDIIEPVMISDGEEQLQRVLPYKVKNNVNLYSTNEFQHDQYIKINRNRIDEISVNIKNVLGNNIHFHDGKCILTLHFIRDDIFNNFV